MRLGIALRYQLQSTSCRGLCWSELAVVGVLSSEQVADKSNQVDF